MDPKEFHRYDDIIGLPHHVSETRPRMSRRDRAAQFSPFAALTGHGAAIREAGRRTEEPAELDEDRKSVLDGRLQALQERIGDRPEATVTYFLPDGRKAGGTYRTVSGPVKKIDAQGRRILFEDGTEVSFDALYDLEPD